MVDRTRAHRTSLRAALCELGFSVPQSHASFVMAHLGRASLPVAEHLATHGVHICPLSHFGWPNAIRVTVGRASDNLAARNALAHLAPVGVTPTTRPGPPEISLDRTS